MPKELFNMKW